MCAAHALHAAMVTCRMFRLLSQHNCLSKLLYGQDNSLANCTCVQDCSDVRTTTLGLQGLPCQLEQVVA